MACAYDERVRVQTGDAAGATNEWLGPNGYTLLSWGVDFRSGGASRLRVRSPEGDDRLLDGVRLEIVEPERVVFRGDARFDGLPASSRTLTFRRA